MPSAIEASKTATSEADCLRCELAALKSSLVSDDLVSHLKWPLSPIERRIFGMMLAQDMLTKKTIVLLLRDRAATAADMKNVDVFISRIRTKTSAMGVKIETIFGVGYRLEGRESWRSTIQAGAAARH